MGKPRLLILGTGFGAMALLRRINRQAYDVTVVSPRNHFVFTPLLPSSTVGTIEFRSLIEPVRARRPGIQFHLGRAVHLDLAAKTVHCQCVVSDVAWQQPYDILVLAVGCVTNSFGVPGVEQHAHFLKEIEDARRIRQSLVANLERASLPGVSPEEQARLLHFVAVGGGPTGVRFAGELHDLLRTDLPRSYPQLVGKPRVTILDSSSSVLSSYDQALREYTQKVFASRGVIIRTATRVEGVTEQGINLPHGEKLPCGMVLWSAGFARNPLIAGLDVEKDPSGRIFTEENLQLPGYPGVYSVGDCTRPRSKDLPQLAQVAEQQGRYLAANLNAVAQGKTVSPFVWKPWAVSSFLGGGAAVSEGGDSGSKLSGFWAYQQWRAATWTQLVSLRSKLLVPADRLRAFVFGREISRL